MSEDEIELRDLIIGKLTSSGKITDLKAQLRAAVLISLSKEQKSNLPTIAHKERMDNVYGNTQGKLALSLMKDLLEKCNLKHTLSVFLLESGLSDVEVSGRESILREFPHVITESKPDDPLLYGFIKRALTLSHEPNDREIIRGVPKSGSNNVSPKSKRVLPQLSDPIEFKSEGSSEFSDVIGLDDILPKKNLPVDMYSSRIPILISTDKMKSGGDKPAISPYQAPQKSLSAGSAGDDIYNNSFSDKSDVTKQNQSDVEESIKEVDVEEIDYKSEERSGDVTVDSERTLSLDYTEIAKRKY